MLGFIFTFATFKDKEDVKKENDKESEKSQEDEKKNIGENIDRSFLNKEIIASPFTGKIIPLKDAQDEAFASGALGRGVAIIPSEGVV